MGGRRSGRAAAKRAAAALESTPKFFVDVEDEVMPDADTRDDVSEHEEAAEHDEEDEDEDEEGEEEVREQVRDDDEDEAGKEDDEEESEQSAKEPTPPPQPVFRRKRLGRPPKIKPPGWDNMVTMTEEEARDTPRRRGRGGWRGRGGRKGGAAPPKAEQVIDSGGTVAEIVDDECVLPEDPEGEEKVDRSGHLMGDREYRCRTFTVSGRENRLYMLSTEPARCVGFRDSYLFFTKHRKLYKIIVNDDEKRDMIEREIIPHSYKGRSIGIVTARSVFREFGARIVVGGRRIADDYNVSLAREEGAVEGQVADPDDRYVPGQPYNKNQYVAWHGASAVYHTNTPAVPVPAGKPEFKRRKVNVNDTNWMLEHAREASTFNASINAIRKLNNAGVYDIHTNVMQYPAVMQPTHACFEQVNPEDEELRTATAVFPQVSLKMARNFYVSDTYYEKPSKGINPSAYPSFGDSGAVNGPQGLTAISPELTKLLPPECLGAFETALANEKQWRARWQPQSQATSRRQPIIDKAIVPYSMV